MKKIIKNLIILLIVFGITKILISNYIKNLNKTLKSETKFKVKTITKIKNINIDKETELKNKIYHIINLNDTTLTSNDLKLCLQLLLNKQFIDSTSEILLKNYPENLEFLFKYPIKNILIDWIRLTHLRYNALSQLIIKEMKFNKKYPVFQGYLLKYPISINNKFMFSFIQFLHNSKPSELKFYNWGNLLKNMLIYFPENKEIFYELLKFNSLKIKYKILKGMISYEPTLILYDENLYKPLYEYTILETNHADYKIRVPKIMFKNKNIMSDTDIITIENFLVSDNKYKKLAAVFFLRTIQDVYTYSDKIEVLLHNILKQETDFSVLWQTMLLYKNNDKKNLILEKRFKKGDIKIKYLIDQYYKYENMFSKEKWVSKIYNSKQLMSDTEYSNALKKSYQLILEKKFNKAYDIYLKIENKPLTYYDYMTLQYFKIDLLLVMKKYDKLKKLLDETIQLYIPQMKPIRLYHIMDLLNKAENDEELFYYSENYFAYKYLNDKKLANKWLKKYLDSNYIGIRNYINYYYGQNLIKDLETKEKGENILINLYKNNPLFPFRFFIDNELILKFLNK